MTAAAAARGGRALLEPLRGEAGQLDPAARTGLERSLGASFGDVVIHTGAASGAAADGLDAAAFTVGRHVVFGPGRYDPASARGRMLLAHELAHVVQQRRGGGDADLGERMPLGGLDMPAAHPAGHGRSAALAALGGSAPVAGATGVGIARAGKDDERDLSDRLAAMARTRIKQSLGRIEGVSIEAGQIADVLLWAADKYDQVSTAAIEKAGEELGVPKAATDALKSINAYKLLKTAAVDAGIVTVDEYTGAPSVTEKITGAYSDLDAWSNKNVLGGTEADDEVLTVAGVTITHRDLGVLEGAIGSQAALALIGATEVQLLLKITSGLGALKAVVDAIERNREGFWGDRGFWTALGQGLLYLVGLRSAAVGKKLLAIAVHVGSTILGLGSDALNVRDAYLMPPGPERDKRLKAAIMGLIRALADQVRQAISAGRSAGAKGPKAAAPSDKPPTSPGATTPPAKGTATTPAKAAATAAKPSPPAPTASSKPAPPAAVTAAKPVPPAAAAQAAAGPAATPKTSPVADAPAAAPKAAVAKPLGAPAGTEAPAAAVSGPASAVQPGPKATAASAPKAAPKPVAQPKAAPKPVPQPKAAPKPVAQPKANAAAATDPQMMAAAAKPPAATKASAKPKAATTAAPTPAAGTAAGPKTPATAGAKAAPKPKAKATAKPAAGTTGGTTTPATPGAKAAPKPTPKPTAKATPKQAAGTAGGTTTPAAPGAKAKAKTAPKATATTTPKPAAGTAGGASAKTNAPTGQPGAGTPPKLSAKQAKKAMKRIWQKATPDIWRALAQEETDARAKPGAAKTTAAPGADPSTPPAGAQAATTKPPLSRPFGGEQSPHLEDWDQKNPPPGYVYGKTVEGWEGTDPVKALTDTELADVVKTGKVPKRVQGELEHAGSGQRIGKWLAVVGVPPEEAAALSRQTDRSNLEPVNRETHAVLDEYARIIGKESEPTPGKVPQDRNPTLPHALDDRKESPFASTSNADIAAIVAALKKPGIDLTTPDGQKLRAALALERQRRMGPEGHTTYVPWDVP